MDVIGNLQKYHSLLFQTNKMNLNIKDINIKSSSGIDLLGVAIDDELNFTKHINNVCTKGARKV